MTTKIEKLYDKVNYEFRNCLDKKFFQEFEIEIETYYAFGIGRVASIRKDEELFTKEQQRWIDIFELGYSLCMDQIVEE
jgi:hypothetical protein